MIKKTMYLRDTICLKRVFWEIENVISANYIDFCCIDTMFLMTRVQIGILIFNVRS